MGQYYTPVLADCHHKEDFATHISGWAYSHAFGNGLKLMEHSYVDNGFVNAIVSAVYHRPARVVWAGDYADEEPGRPLNLYGIVDLVHNAPFEITPEDVKPTPPLRWLLNLTNSEYVDLAKLPKDDTGFTIHPLPLLTAEGNGRGGGDFMRGDGMEYVGRWARDIVTAKPIDNPAPVGWTEIEPAFLEK